MTAASNFMSTRCACGIWFATSLRASTILMVDSSIVALTSRSGAQPLAAVHAVARGGDCIRKLAVHGDTRGFVAIPVGLVGQRRDGHDLAEVEPCQSGVDHVVGRHHDLLRKLV